MVSLFFFLCVLRAISESPLFQEDAAGICKPRSRCKYLFTIFVSVRPQQEQHLVVVETGGTPPDKSKKVVR